MTQPQPPVVPNLYPQPMPNFANGTQGDTGNGIASITQTNANTILVTYTNGQTASFTLPSGVNGSTIYSGTANPPANNIGVAGDYYLSTTTSIMRGPKLTNNSWSGAVAFSIKGQTGDTGASGPTNPIFDVIQYGKLMENFIDPDYISSRNWPSGLIASDNGQTTYSAVIGANQVTGFTGPGVMRMSINGGVGASYSALYWAVTSSTIGSFNIDNGMIIMGMLIRKGSATTTDGTISFGIKTNLTFPPTNSGNSLYISQKTGNTEVFQKGAGTGVTYNFGFNDNTTAVYLCIVIDHEGKQFNVYDGSGANVMTYDYSNDPFASVTGHIVPFLSVGTTSGTTSIFDVDYLYCLQQFTNPYILPTI